MRDSLRKLGSSYRTFVFLLSFTLGTSAISSPFHVEVDSWENIEPESLINSIQINPEISHLICSSDYGKWDVFFSRNKRQIYRRNSKGTSLEEVPKFLKVDIIGYDSDFSEGNVIGKRIISRFIENENLIREEKDEYYEQINVGYINRKTSINLNDLKGISISIPVENHYKYDSPRKKIFSCKEVKKFPFKLNSKAYTNYLNSLNWDDGSKRVFQGLSNCESNLANNYDYICKIGFVTRKDPLGQKICRLSYVEYNNFYQEVDMEISDQKDSCRWK